MAQPTKQQQAEIYRALSDPKLDQAAKLKAINIAYGVEPAMYPGVSDVPTGAPEAQAIRDTKVVYPSLGGAPAPVATVAVASPAAADPRAMTPGHSPDVHRRAPMVATIAARPAQATTVAVVPPAAEHKGILDWLGIRKGPLVDKSWNSPDRADERAKGQGERDSIASMLDDTKARANGTSPLPNYGTNKDHPVVSNMDRLSAPRADTVQPTEYVFDERGNGADSADGAFRTPKQMDTMTRMRIASGTDPQP